MDWNDPDELQAERERLRRDAEPSYCPHGIQLDAPWWAHVTCGDCEVEKCAETGHVYVGDVEIDGAWWETCECGQAIRPLVDVPSLDDDGPVGVER
jgi:hypothetical protein